jgi:AcrR family transcriptional regulator
MRTRSEEKRRQIIRVAAQAFEELGYERTSMLAIAERMSGSKQTLYNYFPSKEDLLRAVLELDVSEVADQAMQEFLAEKGLRKGLVRLGRST